MRTVKKITGNRLILYTVILALGALLALSIDNTHRYAKRVDGLIEQLGRTQEALRLANQDIEKYKNVVSDQQKITGIVTNKLQFGDSYVLVIDKDYYQATKEQYDYAEVGQYFDTSVLVKEE